MTRGGGPGGPDEGFSLVEVIAAMTVFILISTGAIAILITSLRTVRENADRAVAASLAREEVENLRALGADSITPGQTTQTRVVGGVTYTITTSASWATVDQAASPCDVTIAPNAVAFMRVRVEAIGGQLGGPQFIDGLVPRIGELPASTGGSISVKVVDDAGAAVPGVNVTLTQTGSGVAPRTLVTGFDGCLLVTGLSAGNGWQVVINKAGYVAPAPGGTSQTTTVTSGLNSPVAFSYAPAATMVLREDDSTYVIPRQLPLTLVADPYGRAPVPPVSYPVTVTDLYPGNYQAWLGDCSDAGGVQSSLVAIGGASRTVGLIGKPIDIVAPPGTRITMRHAPFTDTDPGSCPSATEPPYPAYTLGTVDDSLVLRVTLPTGRWILEAVEVAELEPIKIRLGGATALCSAVWDTGVAKAATDAAQDLADRANALAADDPDGRVTMAILDQAARDLDLDAVWGPGPRAITVRVAVGAVTGEVVVGVDDEGRAEVEEPVTETVGSPPVAFASTYSDKSCPAIP